MLRWWVLAPSCLALFGALLVVSACGVQPQAFVNGSVQMAGPVAVALAVQPDPPRAGHPASLVFSLHQGNQAIAPGGTKVELLADMPKMSMNLPAIPLKSIGNGQWQAQYTFPMAGGWSATLRVTPPGGSAADAHFTFDVGP